MDTGHILSELIFFVLIFLSPGFWACKQEGSEIWECSPTNECASDRAEESIFCPKSKVCCPPRNYDAIRIVNQYCEKDRAFCTDRYTDRNWPEDGEIEDEKAGRLQRLSRHHPYMALIGYEDGRKIYWICGGVLINEFFVLSATACVESEYQNKWVRAGMISWQSPQSEASAEGLTYRVKKTHIQNDLALLELENKVTFTAHVNPACLPSMPKIPYKYGIVVGWRNSYYPATDDGLVKVLNDTMCDTSSSSKEICSKTYAPSCQGDLGSPLMIKVSSRCYKTIAGIVTFKQPCSGRKSSLVFTRVYHYLPWITKIVWPQTTSYW